MKMKTSFASKVFDCFNILSMCLVIIVMIVPLIHVVSVSLSDGSEVLKGGLFLYPHGWNLKGYMTVLKDPMLARSYLNTIIYCTLGTLSTLIFTSLIAYPLSVNEYVFKKFTTIFLTLTMFVNGGMIPTYLLIKNIGMINSIWVMVIPFSVSAYNVILFRTFFKGIPSSIREAARIDGANELQVLFLIILPLSKAIIATIALFTIVGKWNDWFSALIYFTREEMYPVQMILRKILFSVRSIQDLDPVTRLLFTRGEITPQNVQMALIVIVILPILCIYPFLQKYFVKGVFVGTIKG